MTGSISAVKAFKCVINDDVAGVTVWLSYSWHSVNNKTGDGGQHSGDYLSMIKYSSGRVVSRGGVAY